ncbi:MAG: heme NO-binding domain-containing protein [Methylocystis sp.]|uniref:heme NO-binding domain-containing protein n=1 Tax=Methylocystis sp. TaxID=1911079 RepID=UPI003DA28FAC
MYGIVTKAIGDLIVSQHGGAQWEAVQEKAGVEVDFLVGNEPYPDELAYRLVGAAAETLGCSADEFLVRFGEFWVLKTGAESYGALLKSGGASLKDFLIKLPNFHTRVALIYPQLRPPEFACTDIGETSLRLHYFTERPGLTSFMVGLLQGLSKLYETPLEIALVASKDAGASHDIFEVAWGAPEA